MLNLLWFGSFSVAERSARCHAMKAFTNHSLLMVLLFLTLVAISNGCQPQTNVVLINQNQAFVLNEKDLVRRKVSAFAGNSKAAFEVYLHYGWGLHDHEQGDPWLRLAYKLGSADAKAHLKQWKIAQPSDYARFIKGKRLPKPSD
jgi:hypothetical protein